MFSKEHNIPVSAAVLSYVLYNKLQTIAIIGSGNPAQLLDNLLAVEIEMNAAQADSLHAL